MNIPVLNILEKNTHTTAQATIKNKSERLARLTGTIQISTTAKKFLEQQSLDEVMVVDDVITTGATAHSVHQALKTTDIQKVHFVAIAHGS